MKDIADYANRENGAGTHNPARWVDFLCHPGHTMEQARAAGASVLLLDLRDFSLPLYDGEHEAEHGVAIRYHHQAGGTASIYA